jgi:hypothetical protein
MKSKENNMKIIKKTNLLYALLLLTTIFNTHKTHTMEPIESEEGQTAMEESELGELNIYISEVLLGHKSHRSWILEKFPRDVQNQIIGLLSINDTTNSLNVCAQITNSLAQVNKELNAIINEPYFCLRLIKHLAQRFNSSDFTVADRLKTKEARRRILLQRQLKDMCYESSRGRTSDEYCNKIQPLLEQGVDLEFTYTTDRFLNTFITPLMLASINQKLPLIECLLQKGSNINQITNDGKTTLILITESPDARSTTIKRLLAAGANPTIVDNNGNTALTIAQQIGNKEIINLMQNAIDKKSGKK